MVKYTHLSLEDVQKLAAPYGLDTIKQYKLLSGGSSNTNYRFTTDEGRFVLTICEQKQEKEVMDLVHLLDHLNSNGFATSVVLQGLDGQWLSSCQGKPIMIKKYLEGKIVEDLSDALLELIGRQVGKLHQVEAPDYLPEVIDYGREHFHDLKGYADGSDFQQWLMEIDAYIAPYLQTDLPKALIHSDVFFNNVIISEDETVATIMDFEEAAYYYRLFDVGMTIVGLCKEGEQINVAKAKSFFEGYTQEVALGVEERAALQAFTVYAAAAMSFWRHRNFNYLVPTPGMSEHYRALKNVADHVKSLPATFLVG